MTRVLVFGYGFIGAAFAALCRARGYSLSATARTAEKRTWLAGQGIDAVDPLSPQLSDIAAKADLILITPAPDDAGCPAFTALEATLRQAPRQWLGYLSTTGVYGDRGGGWAFEDQPLTPLSTEGRRRVQAETQWLSLSAQHDVAVFRLPGLYGVGRSVIERLRDGTARRIHKPGQVFSRLYDTDCADALLRSADRRRAGAVYNLCDDEPAPADAVLVWAAQTFGFAVPPEIPFDAPDLSPGMRRFYAENKRVSNALAKAELGWRPAFPTYREGLREVWRLVRKVSVIPH
ncbi:SDR family NAD(P)-dependent oxidoreductase [Asticcacaulis sp. DW145]|uniref:SDR family NAD(P)-dependent oxidoreductase n=1 Tax=Asticcacaulis currens TaxID=2984210 RepID=A0ABT5IEG1_9CAUL|nr:SDR family NAD(P)-dependent oxidoreductase [Asticcacaulis currens]MDC7694544.1 SDR family NAD(P)-dependent oxidoreductase [Asticcacaulis currens]BEV10969.1 SDR family NAD(P)-dependent oxidoreductase [Asticcacaulis sp. DW145]